MHKSNPPKTFRAEYNAVKNHIHNTLNISKEDIQAIIKETVQSEINRIYSQQYLELTIEKVVKQEIYGAYKGASYWDRDAFKQKVAKVLTDQIVTTVANQLNLNVELEKK